MNKQFPYYPQTKIYDTVYSIQIGSILRKQHTDGKWYDVLHRDRIGKHEDRPLSDIEIIKFINGFHHKVYDSIILGVINLELKSMETDKPIYEASESQISEEERLREMYEL